MCTSFPFGFEDGMRNLIVLVPDYCLFIFQIVELTHVKYQYQMNSNDKSNALYFQAGVK